MRLCFKKKSAFKDARGIVIRYHLRCLMRSRGKGRGQVSPHLYHMEIYETDWN